MRGADDGPPHIAQLGAWRLLGTKWAPAETYYPTRTRDSRGGVVRLTRLQLDRKSELPLAASITGKFE